MSLAWLWSGRSLPKGNQWKCWEPRLGPNVAGLQVLLPLNIWPTLSLTSWYFVTWLANCSWQAGWLAGWLPIKQNVSLTLPATKYLTNPNPDKLIFCHMAGWLANCSWQAGWLTAYQTKCQPDPPCHQISDQSQSWQVDILSHGWLAGQLQLASWLTDCLSNKMSTWPSPGRDILWPCVWILWSHRPVVRCT